jgi:hypothetical protein
MSEFAADEDEAMVMRAREKCERNEIDSELLELIRTMKAKGMSPALLDEGGNPLRPGVMPKGFTIRVGVCSCTRA